MELSKNGFNLIKSFEGCRLKAYKAVNTEDYYTIGYGHYGPDVKKDMVITQQTAEEMFKNDLKKYEKYVNSRNYVTSTLNQNQYDALVSFCYNCGCGNLKELCYGKTNKQISEQITLYNKSKGVVLKGLVTRRAKEKELFNTAVTKNEEGKEMVENKQIWINGNNYFCDVILKDGRNFVALNSLKQAGFNVGYNAGNKIPSIANAVEDVNIFINEEEQEVEAVVLQNSTFVKLRDMAEKLGYKVEYDEINKEIRLKS